MLANLLGLPGFDFNSSQDVLKQTQAADTTQVLGSRLGNECQIPATISQFASSAPVVASIYQLDGTVRRATSLQLTADARKSAVVERSVA